MHKIAIIDDNKSIREALKAMISHNFPETFEFHEAGGATDGFRLLSEVEVEIVLLDVEMADGTGIELIEALEIFNFKLVFVTGFKEYALQAIKLNACDYILKPVNPLELTKTLSRILKEIKKENKLTSRRILIKQQEATHIIQSQDICRLQADGPYTEIFLQNGTKLISSKNLKYYESLLEKLNFIRVHHAHLVNGELVEIVSRHYSDGLLMKNGDKVPVSARRKKVLNDFIDQMEG